MVVSVASAAQVGVGGLVGAPTGLAASVAVQQQQKRRGRWRRLGAAARAGMKAAQARWMSVSSGT